MTFMWANMLWLLLIVPVLVLIYVILQRRKKTYALRYANLGLVKQAMDEGFAYKRHIPPALFLVAILSMIAAIARPSTMLTWGSKSATVILAMDVSLSMTASDVAPNRIMASQAAAKTFVKKQPKNVKIGIVAFAGSAFLAQAPTLVRDDLANAIDAFELQRGTAVGSGLLVALATLFPEQAIDMSPLEQDMGRFGRGFGGGFDPFGGGFGPDQQQDAQVASADPPSTSATENTETKIASVPPGSNASAIIILLTDGASMNGPDPVAMAKMIADRGVRVYTVGFGTSDGEIGGFGGRFMRAQLDEATLKEVAEVTKGEYFHATSATDLKAIYEKLNTQSIVETKQTEIGAFFAAAAALFALTAAFLSMVWYSRL